jgi:hypothetical protein
MVLMLEDWSLKSGMVASYTVSQDSDEFPVSPLVISFCCQEDQKHLELATFGFFLLAFVPRLVRQLLIIFWICQNF